MGKVTYANLYLPIVKAISSECLNRNTLMCNGTIMIDVSEEVGLCVRLKRSQAASPPRLCARPPVGKAHQVLDSTTFL